jgi:2,4-dienoyl-CoA reductase-like NADH-dependent reductase (Old Yellow Enzyme family)/pyruvate/2-oxoglutarate dehydrogenase complex dihydrolipoamide dehydrogenase (E3) component
MTDPRFPKLFSPLTLRGVTLKNRIFSTGHDTNLAAGGLIGERLVAYHRARAAGGAGLVIMQVSGVHETARYTSHLLMATSDDSIPGYRAVAQACHAHGCRVFAQLFHPGREIMDSQDGSLPVAYSASNAPTDRFHVMPAPLSRRLIAEIAEGYGASAARMMRAGLDGVEIVASHGYLPAQFLNPRINRREDEYGGSFENRLRFLRQAIAHVRQAVGEERVVGMRISGAELDHDGLTEEEVLQTCRALASDGQLDFYNVIAGSSASLAGAIHIVPPMAIETGYVAPFAAAVRGVVDKPVFVAGRINQPQIAEQVLASGQADMCGMTRAMICDPEMPAKSAAGRLDDIRACIGCNQACIGHFHLGYPISCIQHPETGRELDYGSLSPAPRPKRVAIVGGGPAGMKAASVAAARGHRVTLYESTGRLGGQALLAQQLPGRAEFGGIVTNLTREMELAGVTVVKNKRVDGEFLAREAPDAVVLATGATPRRPLFEGADSAHVVDAWQVLRGEVNVGASVLIADWRCDWIGMGIAEKLARAGCRVRLAVNGYVAGQRIQQYVRDQWNGTLHKLGVEVIPYARLYGADAGTVYLQHTSSGEPIVCDGVDTLVLALGHEQETKLAGELDGWPGELHRIGDCVAPRTAEEAVLEGLKVGCAL